MANDLSAQLQACFGSAPAQEQDSAPTGDAYSELTRLITKVTGVEEGLEREAKLEDLGVESLERIELAVRLEEASGVRLNEETMLSVTTVGELADYVEEHS
ncbi:acyl carrier protein [Corynebacterium sp. HMSC076G08]|uniref:acyl carrier protein n=1 Tax=Corynebacterium sp. HMSC076G08 TaxID=1739310 RepID=UPI0008A40D1C|nr:acyl carrier protein [Corynebacterium sp. HMSC076G08]OFK67403.1 acyl carrier protein [Corynebacterium sp. HMSC076G08]